MTHISYGKEALVEEQEDPEEEEGHPKTSQPHPDLWK